MRIDVAIVTALPVEREAVCAAFDLGDGHKVEKGHRVYWRGRLPLQNRQIYERRFHEVVVVEASTKGNLEAQALTGEVLRVWAPRVVLMVGIAASAKPQTVKLGDVVVGSNVYYYELQKVTASGTESDLRLLQATPSLLNRVKALSQWTANLPVKRPAGTRECPQVHFGIIASGKRSWRMKEHATGSPTR